MKNIELPEEAQVKIQPYLLSLRWVCLLFALIFFLINKNNNWRILLVVAVYNIMITVYLKFYAKKFLGGAPLLFFDLAACAFLLIAGGYIMPAPDFNPFYFYSFTALFGIAFNRTLKGSLLAAFLLSFSYFFILIYGSNEPLMKSELIGTHIANIFFFFLWAVVIPQAANELRSYSPDQAVINTSEQKNLTDLIDKYKKFTFREREVFCLHYEGKSNKEIAEELFIAENTAKKHVANVYKKLGLRRRLYLVEQGKEE